MVERCLDRRTPGLEAEGERESKGDGEVSKFYILLCVSATALTGLRGLWWFTGVHVQSTAPRVFGHVCDVI